MKNKYFKIVTIMSILILSICSLVFADNTIIDNNIDLNSILESNIITNSLGNNINEEQLIEEKGDSALNFTEFEERNEEEKKVEVLEDGTYRIAMYNNSNIGIDVDAGSKENGANVLLWEWYEENNTQKKFNIKYDISEECYTITNINSGKMLDVQNAGTQNGTNVWQYEKNGTDSQKWKIVKNSNGSYSIISKHNGLYLDIKDAFMGMVRRK